MKKKHFFKRTALSAIALVLAISMLAGGVSVLANDFLMTENASPIAENQNLSTYKNISLSGTLSAVDPDGDLLKYALTRLPKKGTAEVNEDGSFTYTPFENKKGKDSFSFSATDTHGNTSENATVNIKIKSQKTDVCYTDLEGTNYEYDAICLAENGVYIGEQIGSSYFFSPDTTVSRGEFLSMCMNMCSVDTLKDITKTGFFDDDSFPMWTKPYIATALMAGIVKGYKDDAGNTVFQPNEPITYSEAVVILDNVLNITDVSSDIQVFSGACPVWAVQSAANLSSCNIITNISSGTLSRGEAAKMLSAALTVLENRASGSSLFETEY